MSACRRQTAACRRLDRSHSYLSSRRHTRSSRYWSSEVCSSDLAPRSCWSPCPPSSAPCRHCRNAPRCRDPRDRSEEHTSELQSRVEIVCRLLLEKKKPPPSCRCWSGSD